MYADDDGYTQVLLETDQGGAYLEEKGCTSCDDGEYVFQDASTVAGVYYAADPFSCQTCPDEHMSFGSGGFCSCDNG